MTVKRLDSNQPKSFSFSKEDIALINKISVMLCICLMIMLAYWLNPYTEPLKQLL